MRSLLVTSLLLIGTALAPLTVRPLAAQELGSFEWQAATPVSQGMSDEKLAALQTSLAEHKTKGILVIRNDRIVLEWYAEGHSASAKHYTASMAKALVGGMAVAVAMSYGRLKLDDKASRFVPAWRDDAKKSQITIGQLGSHTSGLADTDQEGVPHEKLPGWMGEFWKRQAPPGDPFSISRDQTPLASEPGANFQYSNPGIAMLGYAVTGALASQTADAPPKDLRSVLRERASIWIRSRGTPRSCRSSRSSSRSPPRMQVRWRAIASIVSLASSAVWPAMARRSSSRS